MLDPNGSSGERPSAFGIEMNFLAGRNRKPTLLDGAIGPERHVDVVPVNSGVRSERNEVRKNASFAEGGREIIGNSAGVLETQDFSRIVMNRKDVAVARIVAEARNGDVLAVH